MSCKQLSDIKHEAVEEEASEIKLESGEIKVEASEINASLEVNLETSEINESSEFKQETSEIKEETVEITEMDNQGASYLCIQCDSEFIDKAKLKLHVQTLHRPVEPQSLVDPLDTNSS